jgi:hypothetical protein
MGIFTNGNYHGINDKNTQAFMEFLPPGFGQNCTAGSWQISQEGQNVHDHFLQCLPIYRLELMCVYAFFIKK